MLDWGETNFNILSVLYRVLYRMNGKTERREKQREIQSDGEMTAYIQTSECTILK